MPANCCVRSCRSTARRDTVKFFRFPRVNNRNDQLRTISSRRQMLWLKVIKRPDLTGTRMKNARICSRHFISGRCPSLLDVDSPDWIPTLNMDHKKDGNSGRTIRGVNRKTINRMSENGDDVAGPSNDVDTDNDIEYIDCGKFVGNDSDDTNSEIETGLIHDVRSIETQTELPFVDIQKLIIRNDFLETKLFNRNCPSIATQTDTRFKDIQEYMIKNDFLEQKLILLQKKIDEQNKQLENKKIILKNFQNNEKSHYFTGLSYCKLKYLYEMLENDLPKPLSVLDKFQVFLMTFMRLRLDMPFTYLSYKFSVSKQTVSRYYYKTLFLLYTKLRSLIVWPNREQLQNNTTTPFKDQFGDTIVIVIDCFEILIEKPSDSLTASQCWSNDKNCHSIKYLVGISPNGTVIFMSKGYGGSASEKFMIEDCAISDNLEEGDVVISYRGFLRKKEVKEHDADDNFIPGFTLGREQLHIFDDENTRKLKNLRVDIEKAVGLFRKKFLILSRRKFKPSAIHSGIHSCDTSEIDQIVTICCALINLSPPISSSSD